jgi:hypothetical protein
MPLQNGLLIRFTVAVYNCEMDHHILDWLVVLYFGLLQEY